MNKQLAAVITGMILLTSSTLFGAAGPKRKIIISYAPLGWRTRQAEIGTTNKLDDENPLGSLKNMIQEHINSTKPILNFLTYRISSVGIGHNEFLAINYAEQMREGIMTDPEFVYSDELVNEDLMRIKNDLETEGDVRIFLGFNDKEKAEITVYTLTGEAMKFHAQRGAHIVDFKSMVAEKLHSAPEQITLTRIDTQQEAQDSEPIGNTNEFNVYT